jgi:hypothetical protein
MKHLRFSVFVFVLALLAACNDLTPAPEQVELNLSTSTTPTPILVPGNPTCQELLGPDYYQLRVDPGASGTYTDGYLQVKITVISTDDGPAFNFISTRTVDAVIAKGGPLGANLYDYRPAGTQSGTELHAPPANEKTWAGLSHIDFCYQLRLDVSKTAQTTVKRTWSWTIDKTADATALELQQGQSYPVNYDITVSATSKDSHRTVKGVIEAVNNTGVAATVTSVSDMLGSVPVAPNCSVTFPYTLPAGEALTCTYSYTNDAPAVLPDTGTNTATVTTSGIVKGGTATAGWDFANATLSDEIDECIDLTDSLYGNLGTVCASDLTNGSKTFDYTLDMKDYATECGENIVKNIATLTTNDTKTTASDDHTVIVTINCATGCTLTQGYWKTHSQYGPAPYDDTWKQLGEDTPFFKSGQSYYEVLWTVPKGNPYYILAHQYIAAKLNGLAGADTSAVTQDLAAAESFFNMYKPSDTLSKAKQNEIKALAGRLDAYNNGVTGPGHCDEK